MCKPLDYSAQVIDLGQCSHQHFFTAPHEMNASGLCTFVLLCYLGLFPWHYRMMWHFTEIQWQKCFFMSNSCVNLHHSFQHCWQKKTTSISTITITSSLNAFFINNFCVRNISQQLEGTVLLSFYHLAEFCRYGVSPFEYALGESGGSLQLAIINAQIKWPAGPKPSYPDALHQFVSWMLQPQAAVRPRIEDIIIHVDKLIAKFSH